MASVDMSLDDLIKNNKRSDGGDTENRHGGGHGSGPGPTCRFNNLGAYSATPYVGSKRGDLSEMKNVGCKSRAAKPPAGRQTLQLGGWDVAGGIFLLDFSFNALA
ncbi:hypothetical protein Tco_0633797 [Tanacetum coccineum]